MKKKLTKTIEKDIELDKLSFTFYRSDTAEIIDGYEVFPLNISVSGDGELLADKKAKLFLTKTQEKQLDNIIAAVIASLNLQDLP